MSTSIYNISAWTQNTVYGKDDIVSYGSYYYYALLGHTSSPSQIFSDVLLTNPELWGGVAIDSGVTKSQFIWTPSYNLSVNLSPRVKKVQFGDGYEQRVQDGINSVLLEIEYAFENRTIEESTAILHFLYDKRAVTSFYFTPSPPYNTIKKFVCRNWSHTAVFYNNNTIKAKFDEVAN